MITIKFVVEVGDAFYNLRYKPTKNLSMDDFLIAAGNALARAKDLDDAAEAITLINWCLKKWEKIEKAYDKYDYLLTDYKSFTGPRRVHLIKGDDSIETYWVTNGIEGKTKKLNLIKEDKNNPIFDIDCKRGEFTILEDGHYHLKYSAMSMKKMNLLDELDNLMCVIAMDDEQNITLKRNSTPYFIYINEDSPIEIYRKEYISSLNKDEEPDIEEAVAFIHWDILSEKKSDLGLARLVVFEDEDVEILLYFAISTFLLYGRYNKHSIINESMKTARSIMLLDRLR